ncbi:MAG: hypothetical protein DMG05_11420 [Acidobacteria bacterium]|nr:MAG: hypothetical protein DMG05_11420 [Acidobacteriota bacterium]
MSIVLTDLTKRFGRNLVVNKASLEVTDGHLFVLLGGSGSGKSTILRMIAGLIQPDGGTILLNGQDVTLLPPQARGIGFVFQNYSIFRHMTAAENIEFGLRIRKTPTARRRERSEELLDLVGLAGLGRRFPDQLSGGQQQRVALARALAYQPATPQNFERYSAPAYGDNDSGDPRPGRGFRTSRSNWSDRARKFDRGGQDGGVIPPAQDRVCGRLHRREQCADRTCPG